MKYQNWASFEKHLGEASPGQLSLVYLAVSACAFERKMVFSQVIAAIQQKEPHAAVERVDAGSLSVHEVVDKLNSRSLFGGPTIVVVEGIEKLKKAEMEVLGAYVERPAPFSFLLLGSAGAKHVSGLIQKGKKDLIALDLSEEKPWDRKSRLQRYLVLYAQKQGKTLSAEAALYLLEHVSLDLAALEQEMFKLVCYCGERKAIGKEDVQSVCSTGVSVNAWQLSEAVIWENGPLVLEPSIELSWLLPFLGQLRYQVSVGLQLCSFVQQRVGNEEIARLFPQLRGPALAKRLAFIEKRGSAYFHTAAHLLFETELMMKNSTCDPALGLDLLIAKLKKIHDTSYTSAPTQFIG